MNHLSLFSGCGGGLLAEKYLLRWNTIGYVEFNDYRQRVIRQRILDGLLDNAPIFGDIQTFIDSGCAELYRGITDIISGGFPCQPFSVAGKGKAEHDDRNMWPETIRVVSIVRPQLVFFENVPGLLSKDYMLTIFRQLRENGYEALPPLKLGAVDVGACHRRKRIWIVAYNADSRSEILRRERENTVFQTPADTGHLGPQKQKQQTTGSQQYNSLPSPYTKGQQDNGRDRGSMDTAPGCGECGNASACTGNQDAADTGEQGLEGISNKRPRLFRQQNREECNKGGNWTENWLEVAIRLCRVDDGLPRRVERIRTTTKGKF